MVFFVSFVFVYLVLRLIQYGHCRFRAYKGEDVEYVWIDMRVFKASYSVCKSSRALTRGMLDCLRGVDYSGVHDGRYCVVLRRYPRWDSGAMDLGGVTDWEIDEFFER